MTIYHKHHIIPRHMGGPDDPSNLIRLTIEEHAQAHLELFQKYGNKRDWIAHRMLLGQISGAEAWLEMVKLPKSEAWKENHRKRILESKPHGFGGSGEINPFYGKRHTEEALNRMRKPKSNTDNMKFRLNNSTKVTCPHCNKEGQLTNMKRWHFTNCKSVPQPPEISTKQS